MSTNTNTSTHPVEVDHDAIDSVFESYSSGGYQNETAATGEVIHKDSNAESNPDAWRGVAGMIADVLAHQVAPNWDIPTEKSAEWADALAVVLGDMFPGGPGGVENWGPWAKLLWASGALAMCGIDIETMKFKPLRKHKEDQRGEYKTDEKFSTEGVRDGN